MTKDERIEQLERQVKSLDMRINMLEMAVQGLRKNSPPSNVPPASPMPTTWPDYRIWDFKPNQVPAYTVTCQHKH